MMNHAPKVQVASSFTGYINGFSDSTRDDDGIASHSHAPLFPGDGTANPCGKVGDQLEPLFRLKQEKHLLQPEPKQ